MSTVDTTEREELTELLAASSRQDQRAFAELYRRTSSRLFGVCMRMLRDRAEAEEVLQEVFISVWRRADTFDPGKASAVTWLVTMARNRAIDRLRQHRETALDDSMMLDLEDEGPSPAARNASALSSAWMAWSHSRSQRSVKPFSRAPRITIWLHVAECRWEP